MVRPARPRSAAAPRHYRGLTWLGRARQAGGAPGVNVEGRTGRDDEVGCVPQGRIRGHEVLRLAMVYASRPDAIIF